MKMRKHIRIIKRLTLTKRWGSFVIVRSDGKWITWDIRSGVGK